MSTDFPSPFLHARALVTGVSGFTGAHLVQLLIDYGLEVVGLDRVGQPDCRTATSRRFDIVRVDLRDGAAVEAVLQELRPKYIFHLACLCRSNDLSELWSHNVLGTENLLSAAARLPDVSLFVPGSAAEVGLLRPEDLPVTERQPLQPVSAYGLTKAAQILRALAYYHTQGLNVFVGRTFNLLGPDAPDSMVCSAIAARIAAVERGLCPPTVHVAHADSERDFIDIRDAVRAYWAIVTRGRPGEVYNVCTGVPTSVGSVAAALVRLCAAPVELLRDPSPSRRDDVPVSVGSPAKIRAELGWRAELSLEESLASVLASCRARAHTAGVRRPQRAAARHPSLAEAATPSIKHAHQGGRA